jgi:hypothetical protein
MAEVIPEIFRQGNTYSTFSSPKVGDRLHPISKENMTFIEVDVHNGFQVPRPLPFGVMAEVINEGSAKESLLQIWVAAGFYDNNPTFAENIRPVFNLNEFIKEANVHEQIVLRNTPLVTDADTWEASVEPIDQTHGLLQKVQVVTLNDVVEGIWDDELQQSHKVTRSLVRTATAEVDSNYPSTLVLVSGTIYNFITFDELRYGWYLKESEALDTSVDLFTYHTHRSHFWPAVQETDIVVSPLNAFKIEEDQSKTEYVASQMLDVRYKESFNGPCKTQVARKWVAAIPAAVAPTQILTDAFQYQGIFFKFTSPECLHGPVFGPEFVGSDHPVLVANQSRFMDFPATTLPDWPDFVSLIADPVPYKGGFITEDITIFKPGTA